MASNTDSLIGIPSQYHVTAGIGLPCTIHSKYAGSPSNDSISTNFLRTVGALPEKDFKLLYQKTVWKIVNYNSLINIYFVPNNTFLWKISYHVRSYIHIADIVWLWNYTYSRHHEVYNWYNIAKAELSHDLHGKHLWF